MKKTILAILLLMSLSPFAFAAVLYSNDFEGDALGDAPRGWERGFEGEGVGAVIVDPVDGGNQVFAHSDLAFDQARHDVGGNIWVVGDADWQDCVVDYDAYFPEDFCIGVLFRFVDSDNFYLLDIVYEKFLSHSFYLSTNNYSPDASLSGEWRNK